MEYSILYIEPLYIQAETGQLPELKRVLVSDGESVVMEENLALALEALFGKSKYINKNDYRKDYFGDSVYAGHIYDRRDHGDIFGSDIAAGIS